MNNISINHHPSTPSSSLYEDLAQWECIASIVACLVGAALLTLGALNLFGPSSSTGYCVCMLEGGVVITVSVLLMMRSALKQCSPAKSYDGKSKENHSDTQEQLLEKLHQQYVFDEEVEIDELLERIPDTFFEEKSHENAKTRFAEVMQKFRGVEVEYPTPPQIPDPDRLQGRLEYDVFELECIDRNYSAYTRLYKPDRDRSHMKSKCAGEICEWLKVHAPEVYLELEISVKSLYNTAEIKRWLASHYPFVDQALDSEREPFPEHVVQVTSQYNAARSSQVSTPPIGKAQAHSDGSTASSRVLPLTMQNIEFEGAFLANSGFNMLHAALPSAGNPHDPHSLLSHGYLLPTLEQLAAEYKANYHKTEYVCYPGTYQVSGTWHSAYVFLQAAPATAYSSVSASPDELEKYAALANYAAFFQYGIDLARKKSSQVILHATAVGGGRYGNKVENIAWGFEKAALFLQQQMKEHGVVVMMGFSNSQDEMFKIASRLRLI